MYRFVDQPVRALCNSGRVTIWALRAWRFCRAGGFCLPCSLRSLQGDGGGSVPASAASTDGRDEDGAAGIGLLSHEWIGEGEAILLELWDAILRDDRAASATLLTYLLPRGGEEGMMVLNDAGEALRSAGYVSTAAAPIDRQATEDGR